MIIDQSQQPPGKCLLVAILFRFRVLHTWTGVAKKGGYGPSAWSKTLGRIIIKITKQVNKNGRIHSKEENPDSTV